MAEDGAWTHAKPHKLDPQVTRCATGTAIAGVTYEFSVPPSLFVGTHGPMKFYAPPQADRARIYTLIKVVLMTRLFALLIFDF